MIYFIQERDEPTGPVKIGYSNKPKVRLSGIQTSNHRPLTILRQIAGSALAEAWLHKQFADLALRGEWFRFDARMLTIEPPCEEELLRAAARPAEDDLPDLIVAPQTAVASWGKENSIDFVCDCLLEAFGNHRSRAKAISELCGASPRTVEKWFRRQGAPELHHFLNLLLNVPLMYERMCQAVGDNHYLVVNARRALITAAQALAEMQAAGIPLARLSEEGAG